MQKTVELYDTTLRDGAQGRGVSFSLSDKLRIVRVLDDLGIHYIEGGWPGSNPKDEEFFEAVSSLDLKNAVIAAFSMTCRKDMSPEDDSNMIELLGANTKVVTLVGKTWEMHVKEVLRTTPEENLRLIKESCAFFVSHGRQVFYDAEHFFDGFKDNPDYALETLQAAVRGGAERIILCDTNGGSLPWEIGSIINDVQLSINIPLGIHTHNDSGLAVANTIEAVKRGVVQVQGTVNGYGERCGNADLCLVIPDLQLKMGFQCLSPDNLARLCELSHFISEVANFNPNPFQPFVGVNAFTHKGGMHGDAMKKCEESYQHINPSLVGNHPEIVVSELAGKANILALAEKFGIKLSPQEVKEVLTQVKEMEYQGFQFEGADASLKLLMLRAQVDYNPPFEVLDFTVLVKKQEARREEEGFKAEAMIKLQIGDKIIHTAAEGNGPVNALDGAARKALLSVYPELKKVHLADYKVRILDGKEGTGAWVRVLIDFSADGNTWTTVGCSTDIIQASWQAIADSWEYALSKHVL